MTQCVKCKKDRSLKTKNPPVCGKCYRPPKKVCLKCGKIAILRKKLCSKCYVPPSKKCSVCGEVNIVKTYLNGLVICKKCYKNCAQPKKKCLKCNKISVIYDSEDVLCSQCYAKHKQPREKCFICGEIRKVNVRNKEKKPICVICYKTPLEECHMCHRIMEVWKRIESGPMCMCCNYKYKMKNNEKFYITETLRKRVRAAFTQYSNTGKIMSSRKYDIDYKNIIQHLGPRPGARSDYHIDHIFPLSAFDFDNLLHVKACFAPENHQWLKVKDNLSKGYKYNKEEFYIYLEKFC